MILFVVIITILKDVFAFSEQLQHLRVFCKGKFVVEGTT
tara:strand:+ start:1336 stop:1452 length:117 start_codon:yes stop_codon:yes gene_type:complete